MVQAICFDYLALAGAQCVSGGIFRDDGAGVAHEFTPGIL